MISPKLRQFLRYTGVNLASTIVDYGVFLTLTHTFGAPIVESVIGYSVAIVVNYLLTKNLVFHANLPQKSEHRLFMEFAGTGLLGLVLTAVVIWFTIHVVGMSPIAAKTVAVLICFVVLYYVRSRLVFNTHLAEPTAEPAAA